jgi:hypothetical protein
LCKVGVFEVKVEAEVKAEVEVEKVDQLTS